MRRKCYPVAERNPPFIIGRVYKFRLSTDLNQMRIILALKDTNLRLSIELLVSEEPGILIVGSAIDTQGLLALIDASSPNLVLLDWDLPGEPLREVIGHINACESPPEIILLGSNVDGEEEYVKAGAHSFLLKGDPPDKLLSAVRQFY